MLRFNDGISVNTSGPIRKLQLKDGWYVVGNGMSIPVSSKKEADAMVKDLTEGKMQNTKQFNGNMIKIFEGALYSTAILVNGKVDDAWAEVEDFSAPGFKEFVESNFTIVDKNQLSILGEL